MNFFDHKDLGNHLLQLCPQIVKHPVFTSFHYSIYRQHLAPILRVQKAEVDYKKLHTG